MWGTGTPSTVQLCEVTALAAAPSLKSTSKSGPRRGRAKTGLDDES